MDKDSIKKLPAQPGVYLFKSSLNAIIYIGKAGNLRKRVSSYAKPAATDYKPLALMRDTCVIHYITTKTELEAQLLEADLIKRYQPKYNVLLKDGQPFLYLCFNDNPLPALELVRNTKTRGTYFGPFINKSQARSAYRYIMHTFRLSLCSHTIANGCLEYHLGICAGSCRQDFDQQDYRCRLQLAKNALQKDRKKFLTTIYDQIATYNAQLDFERAQQLYSYVANLEAIFTALDTRYYPTKFNDAIMIAATDLHTLGYASTNHATALQDLLKTERPVATIDCFDISHFQSSALVGSCIRFANGVPDTASFRKFKIRTLTTQNDYAALQEIVRRRYKTANDYPDLILIDGGKGQLNAVSSLVDATPIASLAKREERLFSITHPEGIILNMHHDSEKLLIEIRDYAHHFAINYHRARRRKTIAEQ